VIHTCKMVKPMVSVFPDCVINVFLIASFLNLSCLATPNVALKNLILAS
jgi:hypothetical protein